MAGPFYAAVKGTTAGTPGTGAFTPNAASTGFRAWSTVPAGWIGMVRYEDGSSWELQYSYWNGTTLSRSATAQFVASSSGSGLTLTSAATAALIVDPNEVQPHLGGSAWLAFMARPGLTTYTEHQTPATPSVLGTAAAPLLSATSVLTNTPRIQYTSATTANAQAGAYLPAGNNPMFYSTTAGLGGWEFTAKFGVTQLPTGPRLFVGSSKTTINGSTAEPSAIVDHIAAFAKDSTDTNIQLLTNDNSGAGGKTDTGIPLVANGWYEATIWVPPGGGTVYGLLIRLDTGAIWYGSTTTNLPGTGQSQAPQVIGALSSTTGTAIILHVGSVHVRVGG